MEVNRVVHHNIRKRINEFCFEQTRRMTKNKKRLRRHRRNTKYYAQLRKVLIDLSLSEVKISKMECLREGHPPEQVAKWQSHHQLAYWKSRAISLEYENRMLHRHIKSQYSKQFDAYSQFVQEPDEEKDAVSQLDEQCEQLSVNDEEQAEEDHKKKMDDLYGDMAPKIIGMETAMRVGYDLQVNKYNPPLWPNLPLKL